ncbi:MAG: ATP-binding protein [Candidatus Promineifilaceae bacterium]|nr:ATP-binding protein [Candidatus Promineifilaceae bacterium]
MLDRVRWRIAVPYVVLVLVVNVGLAIFLTQQIRTAQLENLREQLLSEAQVVARDIGPILAVTDPDNADRLRVALAGQAEAWSALLDARVTIIAPNGAVIAESDQDPAQMENHLDRPEVQEALRAGQGSSIRFSDTLDAQMLYMAIPLPAAQTEAGEAQAIVRLALPLNQVEATINEMRGLVITAAFVAALATALVAIVVAERTARAIGRLTAAARRMATGDLDARLHHIAPGEIGELTVAFNEMADQLRERVTDLAAERGRLAAVLENMADGVLITDRGGLVQLINPAAARLLDVDPDESIGRSFAEVARHHKLIELWQQGCLEGGEQGGVVDLVQQGLFLQMVVTPLQQVEYLGCLIILQDLTRMRRLEVTRRDFVSNISHELRTPLASLKALVETLHDSALDDPPVARRFLARIDEEIDALTQMVQELLELSRIESGKVPLRLAPTAVAEAVLPAVERLQPQAERHELTVAVDLPGGLPPILADAGRIHQVVGNLVHNAIKFTPDGGWIKLSATLDDSEQMVVISVRDNGVGIPTAELGRIFERFYKADRARSGGGTGLGLAISRHLIQAHGGHIWAESKEGKGSSFYFSLPIAADDENSAESRSP